MTYQNRVDPFGTFHAVAAKGTLMGNRGILHDEAKTIARTHAHQHWVTCALSFKGRQQEIMKPGRYTQLFFLDEATALAAGHRPCAECRRERYNEFTSLWRQVLGEPEAGRSLPETIDRALHSARIARGRKVTCTADIADLPDGVMVASADAAVLIWQGRQFDWSFEGYHPRPILLEGPVEVLTPKPLVEVIRAGFVPQVHASAS
ncbi:hypothetical protein C8J30_105198 [Rhodobacter viridis]|uniref:Metal binding Ada-like protein n=1 Tax=Rhodobacter viridis TaxID=1054202 RepID=A0A318TZ61_9RHOB|nr:hypothetical protein [Rhodobacter viridis]PYF10387.1 hypothetical protein C8J30_105198 [Rhodobacter viridis]